MPYSRLVPVAGDIFLAAWKANSRNALLYVPYAISDGISLTVVIFFFFWYSIKYHYRFLVTKQCPTLRAIVWKLI